MLEPPLRYACVDGRIYRGGYPQLENIPFLHRLRLRTIVSVTPEPLAPFPAEMQLNVNYIHITSGSERSGSKKKRGIPISLETVQEVLDVITRPDLQPVYVHCLNGQQVTSLVIGCLRLRQGWASGSMLEEFAHYADYNRADIELLTAASDDLM